jgi:hypothetical protein
MGRKEKKADSARKQAWLPVDVVPRKVLASHQSD